MEGRRRKGRPKRRWMDSVNLDFRKTGLSGEETQKGLCMEKTGQKHRL